MNDRNRFGAVEESAHYYEAFSIGREGRYCTENTLYIALLVAQDLARGSRPVRPPDRHPGDDGKAARMGLQVPQRPGPRRGTRRGPRAFSGARGHRAGPHEERHGSGGYPDATRPALRRQRAHPSGVRLDSGESARCSQSENGLARWEVVGATAELVSPGQARDRGLRQPIRRGRGISGLRALRREITMNVLVTGGAGYVGSHAAKLLAAEGHEIWVYDNLVFGHRAAVRAGPADRGRPARAEQGRGGAPREANRRRDALRRLRLRRASRSPIRRSTTTTTWSARSR